MATEDSYEIYRGPCVCGRGEFVVIESEPDHPWVRASQRNWSTEIRCADCAATYQIEHRDRDFRVLKRSDVEAAQRVFQEQQSRRDAFMQRADVKQVRADLEAHLAQIKAKAEVFRQVSSAGFFVQSAGTFSKQYPGAAEWVKQNVSRPRHIANALRLLGRGDSSLASEADRLEKLATPPELLPQPVRVLDVHAGH